MAGRLTWVVGPGVVVRRLRRLSIYAVGKHRPNRREPEVAKESTFDIVSKVDKQEVSNALNQAQKEISQRYDFRGNRRLSGVLR